MLIDLTEYAIRAAVKMIKSTDVRVYANSMYHFCTTPKY